MAAVIAVGFDATPTVGSTGAEINIEIEIETDIETDIESTPTNTRAKTMSQGNDDRTGTEPATNPTGNATTGTRHDDHGTSETETDDGLPELPPKLREAVPDWDDEYLDRVAGRLVHTYDLEKDVLAGRNRFDLYGELRVESSKHMFHPSVQYANHHMREYLYADRRSSVSVADLEELVALGHDLADERVDPNDEHRATEFTFVLVVPDIPQEVRSFVAEFRDRTLIRFGFHGHYEIHCCVVAPERETIVASDRTEIDAAFALWEDLESGGDGLLARVRGLVSL
ncbi:hypothetical protein C446_12434 [Halobiforma nitratireducens JCM 10879]|uniref:DUF8052 domain-containing protein n=2 Tax=Halobiforma nitratireducens TaxID=130048 RepID=M0LPC9_9EURY|nr:hypothetical protein C446_12434 [Halobiforma nitratireducens JCM 10879]